MRINSRKSGKFSGEFGQLLHAFLKPFCTQEPLDASARVQKGMRKLLFNYYFYSHPEIGNFRV
jgi:hypothetical protein